MIPMQVPMDNYQFQPALQYLPQYQPTIQPQHWSDNSSLKTFSDIESYMTSRKLKDMPQWKPNQYQQMPIYCESRSEYEFLVKAIMHRKDLELHIEDLDIKREADKNQRFILAMKESIREPIQDLSSASQSQIQLLTTQNQALQCLLEKKPSPNLLPLQPSSQPPPILTTSPSSRSLTFPVDAGCNDSTHSDGIDL